jgi:hypothetical protein
MNRTFDLVDFSKYTNDVNMQVKRNNLSNCFDITFPENENIKSENENDSCYNDLMNCKGIIDENINEIVKEFPDVRNALDPTSNSFTKGLIDDGYSVKDAYSMGFLLVLIMIATFSK